MIRLLIGLLWTLIGLSSALVPDWSLNTALVPDWSLSTALAPDWSLCTALVPDGSLSLSHATHWPFSPKAGLRLVSVFLVRILTHVGTYGKFSSSGSVIFSW